MGKEDPEKRRARNRRWYLANKERKNAATRAWLEKNAERARLKAKARREAAKAADPEGYRLKQKMYRIAYEERRERMAIDRDRPLGLPAPRR